MLLSQQLDGHRNESGASKLRDAQGPGETWRCPSCRDAINLAQQVSCSCGYRVCQPCWQIAANFGGQCPTCGCPPDVDSVRQRVVCRPSSSRGDRSTSSSVGSTISRSNTPCQEPPTHQHPKPPPLEQLTASSNVQQQQQHQHQQQQQQQQQQSVFIRGADRRVLQNLRVIQRTLVYAIGLSPNFAQPSTLKQPEYFGQYGEITKLVINHHQGVSPDDPRYGSASAYITFRRQEDAWAAICSVDGFRLMGRTVRASFGTTKYCNSFLRNLPCNNPECLYLHELGDEGDRFTKDEVQLGLARHGSSFAFKEEVLGDRSGGSNLGSSRTYKPQPTNPVLPPPCPRTPPAAYDGGLPNGGCGGSVGRGPAPAPPLESSPACRPGAEHVVAAPGVGGGIGLGGDGRWIGATPGSPLPMGADGRPRPRRRRGQRGRRGGGVGIGIGGGGTGGFSMSCSLPGDSDESSMFGSSGMRLLAPTIDVGIGGSGGGAVLARTSSIPVPPTRPMTNECGAGGYGHGVTGTSLDSAVGRERTTSDACAARGIIRPLSATSGAFGLSDGGSTAAPSLERFDVVGGAFGGGVVSSGDLHHPVPKQKQQLQQQSWGGSSDRSSAGSCRSTPVGGNYFGRSYWMKGRGSPLATPETLTNTPPMELSPSGAYSPPSAFPGLGGASQSLWPPRGFGDAGTAGARVEEREKDAHAAAGGMYAHHRHLQLRAPPTFFGIGDGQQLHDGSRVGDLRSISEMREVNRQGRSRSVDLIVEQQQQQQRWNSGGGGGVGRIGAAGAPGGGVERTSMAAAAAVAVAQMQRQHYLENAHVSYDHDGDKGCVSLFAPRLKGCGVAIGASKSSSVDLSSLPPPGLSLVAGGGAEGNRGTDRLGSSYAEDLSRCSDRLAALSWDDNGESGSHDVVASSSFSQSGATSTFGLADSGGDTWSPPSFSSVDPFAASASQAEASQWRRSTPKLFT